MWLFNDVKCVDTVGNSPDTPLDSGEHCAQTLRWTATATRYPKRLASKKVFCIFLNNLLVNLVPNYIFWKLFKGAIQLYKVCLDRGKQS
jgi:hypothetical protein